MTKRLKSKIYIEELIRVSGFKKEERACLDLLASVVPYLRMCAVYARYNEVSQPLSLTICSGGFLDQ